jgi:hypothetical protein
VIDSHGDDGMKIRRKACESGRYVVIADGKFQPSGISGKSR